MARMPYTKLLTNTTCSSRTVEYWSSIIFELPRCARSVLPRRPANIPQNGPRTRKIRCLLNGKQEQINVTGFY